MRTKLDYNTDKTLLSGEVLWNFFTLSNFKEFFSQFQVIFYWLALFWVSNLATKEINWVFEEIKYDTAQVLNQKLWADFDISKQEAIDKIFQKVKNNLWNQDIDSPEFQKKLYDEIKAYEELTWIKLIQSLILWFLYWFAYYKTIKRVRDEKLKIDVKSFLTFCLTSWWMVLVNWFVPWSIVYLESFLLAGYAVYLHLNNVVNEWNDKKEEITPEEYNAIVLIWENLDRAWMCFSYYNSKWKPVHINKTLEKISWFTYQDYLNAWEEAPELEKKYAVMKLQYKWENLKKVLDFVWNVDTRGWYTETFRMDTKFWKEAILSWTTIPDGKWWTLRTAVELTDEVEKQKALEKTRQATRTDRKTKALNELALFQDLHQIFTNIDRKWDPKIKTAVIIDLDNFKWINDVLWHNVWDEVLIKFVDFIYSHIRAWDNFYRIGWDEFAIIFDSDDIEFITKKINELREWFLEIEFPYELSQKPLQVSSSWGFKVFDVKQYYSKDLSEEEVEEIFKHKIKEQADYYMYAVKYFRFILGELETRWLDLSQIDEKNWQAYPLYDESWEFIWVRVIKTWITFDLSVEELALIDKRKQGRAQEIANRQ